MALYSAKEAKWYRRNVERREHCQFNFPPISPASSSSFGFRLSVSFVRRTPRPFAKKIRKLEFLLFFIFFFLLLSSIAPSARPFSIDPLLKVSFNYITCCSCQATRGYKTLRAKGCAYRGYHKYGVDRTAR